MMKKTYVFLIALSVSVLLIGCNNSSNSSSKNTSNSQAKADWFVYDIETLIEKSDVVVFVESDKTEKKKGEGPSATLSTLKVTDLLYGSAPESIILDHTIDSVVEPGKSYLLFLNRKGDYYYLTDGNSLIPENDKIYQISIPGIEGKYDKDQLTKKVEEESK